ncbi:MAG: hypothetical protein AB7G21_06755 [Dehalococcoidia bacterium]
MAAANPAESQPVSQAVRGRMRRQREEELLVWPDLVFIEFISAVVFTILLVGLSVMVDAILLDRANPAVTPNPSKAPWYFLNLQELLLHMHPALAGVIVPTVALIALGAIPYWDNDNEGQGEWLSGPRHWLNVWVGTAVAVVGTLALIFFDDGMHAKIWKAITGAEFPIPWLVNMREFQGKFPLWQEGAPLEFLKSIPLGGLLRADLLGGPKIDFNINVPAVLVEQVIPVTLMIGLPVLLSLVAHRRGIAQTRRDHMILQFSGFIAVYVTLTIVGTYFRGEGLALGPYTIFANLDH